ncbi:DUF3040 domain-containing protein [Cellulomonas sp. DKR-3]|uniref:DUF3040 domain-containing protein n=1 Tax=Cellulomonas fulva TaxID=2835530 RepID=A0ABS5U341_9CELL|nr:DUF3040 domain-containing protein [Cellulomonas fulva]MBT0995821.1 DUF3040 domain-containing protein [Cellulomonas fulva]
MPLSEYEQRVLEQMERQLASDDPRLANTLTQRGRRSFGRYLIAGAGAVVGLLLLVFGAAYSAPVLGVVGFVVMFAAVAYAFANPRRSGSGPQGVVTDEGAVRKPRSGHAPKAAKQGFMARMEERWDKRRGQGGL